MRSGEVKRTAVVLLNLGGPDSLAAVKPFLLNLFKDPAILRVPFFIRPILANVIARARVKPATEIYKILGGRSPLLGLTEQQARALEAEFEGEDVRCFIAMRYWHPFAAEAVREVKAYAPDQLLLLPLYPQFSTTTTGSSLTDWREAAVRAGLVVPTTTLCCWYSDINFIAATANILRVNLAELRRLHGTQAPLRILFSAHGLPEIIVKRGDPYQMQIERTAAAILHVLRGAEEPDPALDDTVVCYQSRATPQQWLTPSTETEIERAGSERIGLLVVPLAFVSEHSETLVELDIEYRELAEKVGVPFYGRAPTQNSETAFIAALAALVRQSFAHGPGLCRPPGRGECPRTFVDCPYVRSRTPAELDAVA